jgi:Flp pilus assembly protein TadB
VPRTPQEQTEQVTGYAEILEAQRELQAKRSNLFRAGALSLIVTAIVATIVFGFSASTATALLVALLNSLLTVMLGLRFEDRLRKTSERLSSLQPKSESPTSAASDTRG